MDKKFPLLSPDPDLVDIRDIAHALSNLCRFTGHARKFYSVAQHSVIVSELASPEDAAWGLLHDSAEAYVGDLSAPVKGLHALSGYKDLEISIILTIAKHFKLHVGNVLEVIVPETIKLIDKELLMREAELFFGPPPEPWIYADLTPSPVDIVPLLPEQAEELFLARYEQIFSG